MGIKNLTFITPVEYKDNKMRLSKRYSQTFSLKDNKEIYLSSHSGINQKPQQDSLAIAQNNDFLILLLADGIGGMYSGEKASYNSVNIIKKIFEQEDPNYLKELTTDSLEEFLYTIMYEIIIHIPPYSGTTLNLSIICPDKTFIANIGNSRIYTIKNNNLKLETYDDSLSFKNFKPQNQKERDNLRFYIKNNEITNAIIQNKMPNISIKTIDNTDYQTICHLTDGITNVLSEEDILKYTNTINPADSLVHVSTYGKNIINPNPDKYFLPYIERGQDNATALIYKK